MDPCKTASKRSNFGASVRFCWFRLGFVFAFLMKKSVEFAAILQIGQRGTFLSVAFRLFCRVFLQVVNHFAASNVQFCRLPEKVLWLHRALFLTM